jgi:hypothetical protein
MSKRPEGKKNPNAKKLAKKSTKGRVIDKVLEIVKKASAFILCGLIN